ncbi:hypothetical protein V502_03843 [Pseudogymnoascus sp. VKM F-4520 (FW-2644)]|nr:hypothetical protein V502_03843 [Pseudogymnoascus sp. VKM F-4520 (FW-2644)]
MSCQESQLVLYPAQPGQVLQEEKMEEDIAGHGSTPVIQKAQEEGIYASLMSTTNMIVRRLDQGLTQPPKIHPETLTDNGESHKESTSKEHATKDSTSEARDRHLKDDISQENASNNDCMNETQQEHTGKVYDPCQHILPILHHRQEKLTDGPSGFSVLGQKQLGFCSSSQAPDRALKLVPEHRLARTQSAGCQGNIDEEPANQLQLARINENIPSVCPMGDRAMPGSSRLSQDTVTRTQRSKGSDVGLLCSRECTTAIEQPVAAKHLTSQQTDDLPYRGIRDRGQELTLSLGSMVKKRLSGSELSCATLKGVVNKGDGKATGNVSAPEQLQDEKSQDEKLQYEQPQDKIHTSGQVPASMVEEGTKGASGVSCGVESPKAKGVEARLYSPIYKSPKANASSQVNTTIAATIRNRPASKHISATLQHRSLSTLYSSHPQLIALRSYIATAPLPSPGVRKIQQLILSAIDGEIELEGNPGLDTQLDAIFHRMAADEKFQNGVIGFGHSVTENDAGFSNQSFGLGANTTASKAPISIFNIKTCTLEELKEEYNAIKAIAKRDHQLLLNSDFKRNSLEKGAKALKQECDHWKTISSSVPGAKTAANESTKWMCTSCGLLNDSWADLTEWAPAKAPRVARLAPEEAEIPESNKFTWVLTEYCRYCGRHKTGGRPQQSAKSPIKRKLANVAMGGSIANNGEQSDEQIKRHCCKNMMSEIKSDASGRAAPTTQIYQVRFLDSPATAPDAQLPQVPLANQYMANIQQGQSSGGNYSAKHLPNVSGIVSDQHCFPSINGTVPNQQFFPNGNDTVAGQRYFPTDNATTGGQQFLPIGNGTIGDQQYFPAGNGVVRDQQYSPSGSGTISDQQHSPNSSGTITSQQSSPSGSGTITYQQSPSITGTDTSQNYLPSTNGSITNQQFVPNSFDMYTDQFAGGGDFFEFFDFDAAGESQDRFRATDWRGGIDLLNAGVATSTASATPNASSPDQTTLPFPSATPPSGGNSYQSLIGFDDDINSISPEDMNLFHSIQNDQADQAAAKTSAKPQSKAQSKIAKPGVKYDMRGNQIGPSTLSTIRNRKPMAPRTAKVGVLTFPTSAAPKNAAPETTQHPNGG